MISSTCLGTLVVPAFFVVVQRLSERFGERLRLLPAHAPSPPSLSQPIRVTQPLHEETQA